MRVLTIETSTTVEEVAVVEDGTVMSRRRSRVGRGRSDALAASVAFVLESSAVRLSRLDAVAVSVGPGRFTGLRVGLATAKGLSSATGVPVVPVPTLEALAMSARAAEGLVCPVLDARRGEVYAALFRSEGSLVRLMPDVAIAPGELAARVLGFAAGAAVLFVGTGIEQYRAEFNAVLGESAVAATGVSEPVPEVLAAYAENRRLDVGPADCLEPVYLRGI